MYLFCILGWRTVILLLFGGDFPNFFIGYIFIITMAEENLRNLERLFRETGNVEFQEEFIVRSVLRGRTDLTELVNFIGENRFAYNAIEALRQTRPDLLDNLHIPHVFLTYVVANFFECLDLDVELCGSAGSGKKDYQDIDLLVIGEREQFYLGLAHLPFILDQACDTHYIENAYDGPGYCAEVIDDRFIIWGFLPRDDHSNWRQYVIDISYEDSSFKSADELRAILEELSSEEGWNRDRSNLKYKLKKRIKKLEQKNNYQHRSQN